MPARTKPRTTLSAPCLVRVKISARSIVSRRNTSMSVAGLAARSTRITRCSTRSTVVATGVTATLTGSRSICAASSAMARGMVAENISVCRSTGSLATILRMSWMKPMSSMRSASSSTRNSTSPRRSALLLHEIEQPARRGDQDVDAVEQRADLRAHRHAADHQCGLQTQMAAVGAEAVEDLAGQFARRAEHQDAAALAHRRPRARPRADAGSAARRPRSCRFRSAQCRSRRGPTSRVGMVWAWIGVGVRYFSSASARVIASLSLKSAKGGQ